MRSDVKLQNLLIYFSMFATWEQTLGADTSIWCEHSRPEWNVDPAGSSDTCYSVAQASDWKLIDECN